MAERASQTTDQAGKYDRIEIGMPEDVEWEPVEGNGNRVRIFEFSEEKARLTEVDKRNGKIYGEGVENYWFNLRDIDSCPAFDRRKSLMKYFNLNKQERITVM